MKKFYSLIIFTLCISNISFAQLSGIYIVGPTGDYTTLPDATSALAINGYAGDVILELQDGFSSSTNFTLSATATDATHHLTIRPEAGATNVNFSASIGTATFTFQGGSQNVTIDGRPGGSGFEKVLTVTYSGTGNANGFFVRNPSDNITIKYTNIRFDGNRGIDTQSGSGSIFIENNDITSLTDGAFSNNATFGIVARGIDSTVIRNNKIYELRSRDQGSAIIPLYLEPETNSKYYIYNNFISLEHTASNDSARIIGIYHFSNDDVNTSYIVHNTISIAGSYGATSTYDFRGIERVRDGDLIIKNNILAIKRQNGNASNKHPGILISNLSTYPGTIEVDDNLFDIQGTNSVIGAQNTDNNYATTLGEWQAFGYGANSILKSVTFEDENTGDLRLSSTHLSDTDFEAGSSFDFASTGIYGATRDATPIRGAHAGGVPGMPTAINISQYDPLITIYPNPTSNIISIETEEVVQKITLKDLTGKQIGETNSSTIDVSSLKRGVYIVTIQTNKGIVIKKIEKL